VAAAQPPGSTPSNGEHAWQATQFHSGVCDLAEAEPAERILPSVAARVLFGLALFGLVIALVQFGKWFLAIGLSLVGAVIAWEVAELLYRFLRRRVRLYLEFRAEQRRELAGR
jgi:hypothetical protein